MHADSSPCCPPTRPSRAKGLCGARALPPARPKLLNLCAFMRGRRSPSPDRRPRSLSARKQTDPSPADAAAPAAAAPSAHAPQSEKTSHTLGTLKWATKTDKAHRR